MRREERAEAETQTKYGAYCSSIANKLNYSVEYLDSSILEVLRESYQKPLNEKRVAQIVAAFDESVADEPTLLRAENVSSPLTLPHLQDQHTISKGEDIGGTFERKQEHAEA